jgi:hypothetical protein
MNGTAGLRTTPPAAAWAHDDGGAGVSGTAGLRNRTTRGARAHDDGGAGMSGTAGLRTTRRPAPGRATEVMA